MNQKTFKTPAVSSILQLQSYETGKLADELALDYGLDDVLKLASNENALGCSPYVTLAITEKLGELARYPDGNAYQLKQAIADMTEVAAKQVTLGNGGNDLLNLIARTFVNQDDSIVYSQHAFIMFSMIAKMIGAEAIEAPAHRYGHDLDAMLTAIIENEETRLVFIANPNNPTGTLLTQEDILSFVQQVPSHVLIVLDEAYVEYCPKSDNKVLLNDYNNVIIVRTFSKAYGLASLRVGYALSHPDIAAMLNRVRQPFNVSVLAQSAAMAALKDQEFIAKVHKLNDGQRRWLCKQFDALGLGFVAPHANFVMVNVGDANGIYQALLKQGVIVRPLVSYGLDEWLRVSVGTPEDNTRLIDTLRDILETL